MKYQETIYYENELSDDFATSVKKIHSLPQKYKYVSKNAFFKLFSFIIYRIFLRPFAWLYIKLRFHQKFINKKAIKQLKTGYFIYVNHATIVGDAFIPNILNIKKRNYILTGEQANSLTPILPILNSVGAIPLTDNLLKTKEMLKAIKYRFEEKSTITIYPEAHVWPYYTDIRPFESGSFKYVAKLNAPMICMTNCFQKKKFGKRPKIITYIDGPFYPDRNLNSNENAQYLRDLVYQAMKENTKNYSTYSYFNYVKKTTKKD